GGQRHTVVPVRVSGRGDYRRFQGFLHLLRQNMPDLAVASFDLTATGLGSDIEHDAGAADTPAANRNSGPTASFVLDLLWFTQPGAAQPGPWADGK
ncbi:MAG TPA: hypothetical protein VNL70_10910, partial [Tepidisphaeraceae bacterium]|nr:hypothetical protein [Tepidisphaeraceae bacterium]